MEPAKFDAVDLSGLANNYDIISNTIEIMEMQKRIQDSLKDGVSNAHAIDVSLASPVVIIV